MKLLIVGNPADFHLGAHLLGAARSIGWEADIEDTSQAWSSSAWQNKIHHHLLGKRPPYFNRFNHQVLAKAKHFRPDLLITTGIAPINGKTLLGMRQLGIPTINFLTDDPWNSRNGARYFWESLVTYDLIANPRYSNLEQLKSIGCKNVKYVPFAYNPNYHFIESDYDATDVERFSCDVAILGGADEDRVPLARVLAKSGLNLALYGSYWDRYSDLRPFYRGSVYGRDLRLAVKLATSQICMVRRRNRDGHAMRSLEFPAMGACLAVEDTTEHRALFGADGDNVVYWDNNNSLVQVTKNLVLDKDKSIILRNKLIQHITVNNYNTYTDRLLQIKKLTELL